ncbi:MBL fold metallo-hydrolase [Streptomyces sp. M10(2022)]
MIGFARGGAGFDCPPWRAPGYGLAEESTSGHTLGPDVPRPPDLADPGAGRSILIDPVLKPAFGLPGRAECRVWPPREIDTAAMPAPDAVVLTHEHLDHFHLPSLDLLDRSTPVFSGPMLPAPVSEAIERLGFSVRRVDHTHPIELGDMRVTLYPAGAQTLFWEDRVVQPCIRVQDGPSVFVAVDADVSDLYIQAVQEGTVPVPRMAVVSNNSQIVPSGMPASSVNLLPGAAGTRHKTGLSVLNQLLLEVLEPLEGHGRSAVRERVHSACLAARTVPVLGPSGDGRRGEQPSGPVPCARPRPVTG